MAHPPIKEGANADLACERKPRVPHRDGTCLNSDAYEITAELPGMSESDVEVVASDGGLTIKGEKKEG